SPIRRACGSRESEAWAAPTSSRATLIQEPMRDASVAVNAAVAQERPVAAHVFKMLQITLADQDFFLIMRGFNDDPSKGIAQKRSAPESQALAFSAVAIDIAELMTYTIDHAHKNAVGNGVRTLNSPPGIMLHGAEFSFFVGMP